MLKRNKAASDTERILHTMKMCCIHEEENMLFKFSRGHSCVLPQAYVRLEVEKMYKNYSFVGEITSKQNDVYERNKYRT